MNARILCAVALILAGVESAKGGPVTTDLWDVSQGTTITASSGVGPGDLRNMFGGTFSSAESGNAFFRDDRAAGFVHFVEWRTVTPVTVAAFNLFQGDDDRTNPGDRGIARFQLFARNLGTGAFDLLYDYSPTLHPYVQTLDPDRLLVSATLPAFSAQDFRAEFTQFAPNSDPGPRIFELDAFSPAATAVPEPASLACVVVVAGFACVRRWRKIARA